MFSKLMAVHTKNTKRIKAGTVLTFFLALALCLLPVFAIVLNRCRVERLTMEQLIMEKSINVNDVVSKLLYKTQILSSVIMQNHGEVENFEQMATTIIDDPAILNILIAPDGVVSDVYPPEGNEAVIGLDFFSEGAGNKEAVMAKETGQLVLGGPFDAVQGWRILVGRLPVYINPADDTKRFWGLVSVTLKYPQALDGAGLNELRVQGFAYEMWRINPDNNERQIISDSGHSYNKNTHYVERQLSIANANWYIRILPVRMWYEFPETWAAVLISICVSVLITAVMQNNQDLKAMQQKLETLSNTDYLTGIYSRRFFMETVGFQMDKVIRTNSESYIIMFDLDHFKKINDKYGHKSGDMVLNEISARVTKTLRSYDLLARYGGEEFVIFVADMNKETVILLAERIRLNIAKTPVEINGASVSITASLGIAPAAPVNDLNTALDLSDKALYKAKEDGRDRSVFYEDGCVVHEALNTCI